MTVILGMKKFGREIKEFSSKESCGYKYNI